MKAIILAPHQDDEMLAAGYAICEWVAQGVEVHVAWVTDGRKAYTWALNEGWLIPEPGKTDISEDELAEIRKKEAENLMEFIGIPRENLHFFGLPDQGGDANIEPAIEQLKPLLENTNILVMPARDESHIDHAAGFQIGIRAVQELRLDDIDIYLYKLYGEFKGPKDRKIKFKMTDREKFIQSMHFYESQKNLGPTWAQYEAAATASFQLLVKVKLEDLGNFPWF